MIISAIKKGSVVTISLDPIYDDDTHVAWGRSELASVLKVRGSYLTFKFLLEGEVIRVNRDNEKVGIAVPTEIDIVTFGQRYHRNRVIRRRSHLSLVKK